MRFVTTCHKAGFEEYGHRLLAGWHHFPKEAELWWYTEGYEIPATERVFVQDINQIHKLVEFKERYKNYISPQFDMDVVRFSHKVYAAVDALHDYDGIGGWIDADCVPYKDIPYSMLVDMLGDAYVACFQRPGSYTETGFWLMNCAHEAHKGFMNLWQAWYDQDAFVQLPGWTDCHTFDATVYRSKVKVNNLSGEFGTDLSLHPMAKTEIAKYLDHCKGERKTDGFSPENFFRSEADALHEAAQSG